MSNRFIVLFDACVLYPSVVRDLLVELAVEDLYQAKWTEKILDEWIESLCKNRPDLKRERLERTCRLLNKSIEDCLVKGYEDFSNTLKLPDPNDRHVLAAAVKIRAQTIVTYNLKDFPNKILNKYDIEAQHPDDFFLNQAELEPAVFLWSVKSCRIRMKKPPKTPEEYLEMLQKASLIRTSAFLKRYIEEI